MNVLEKHPKSPSKSEFSFVRCAVGMLASNN